MTEKAEKKKHFRFLSAFGPLAESPLKWFDWVILALLMVFCFLSFQMRDLFHTAGCSYGYLDGHVFDFYDYLASQAIGEDGSVGLGAAYLPTIYILFAVWNLPMKLFGLVPKATFHIGFIPVMWAKILPCLAYLGGGIVLYRIAKELGMGNRKAKFALFAYLSMPVALFSQFVLGQYESFVVLTVLLGVYMWLKKKHFWFVFWFAVGLTFKYTVLIYFIPLLFLREKKIWKILLSMLGVVLLAALEILIYRKSPAFSTYAFGIGNTDAESPMNTLFSAFYETGNQFTNVKFVVYIVVLAFSLVAAYGYFKQPKDDSEEQRYAMYLICLSFASLFCFTKWHAHYLMLAVPFWTLTAFMHKNTKIFLFLDFVFMAFFVMFNVQAFAFFHDETLVNNGILKLLLPNQQMENYKNLSEYLGFLDTSLVLTVLTALMAVYAVFKHPRFMREDFSEIDKGTAGFMRFRTVAGMLVFLIPVFLCIFSTIHPPKASYMEDVWNYSPTRITLEDQVIAQPFTASSGSISKLKFRLLTNEENEETILTVSVTRDAAGNEVLYEKELKLADYYDGERVILKPALSLDAGENYYVLFRTVKQDDRDAAALMGNADTGRYRSALVNGKEADFHVLMNIID